MKDHSSKNCYFFNSYSASAKAFNRPITLDMGSSFGSSTFTGPNVGARALEYKLQILIS